MRTLLVGLTIGALGFCAYGEKKALGHEDFDQWKGVRNYGLSNNGLWAAYAVNPQEGDGILTIYNTRDNRKVDLPRGYNPMFTADGKWLVALIKAEYSKTREAKIAKKKDYDLPQDSLAILNLSDLRIEKTANVTAFKLGEKGGNWVAYTSVDTAYITAAGLKDKKSGLPMIVRDLSSGKEKVTKWVKSYEMSKDGSRVAVELKKSDNDSISTNGIGVMFLPDTSYVLIDRDKEFYSSPVFNEAGDKIAYTASNDTAKSGTLDAKVYMSDLRHPMIKPLEYALSFKGRESEDLRPNQYTRPTFSHDGRRLIAGVAPIVAADDTTRHDFETATLDIWRWDAPYTPPQEAHRLEDIRKKNFPVVIDLANGSQTLVTDNPLAEVVAPDRWDGRYALVLNPEKYIVSRQWDYFGDEDMEVVDLVTGQRQDAGVCMTEEATMSPCGKYIYWYKDKNYYTYNPATGVTVCVSTDMPVTIWDTEDDHPSPRPNYGVAGWTKDDRRLLIYDKYDIWQLDPDGKEKPECMTAGVGRKNNLRYRYLNTDPDRRYISDGETILLDVFDYTDKYRGLATMKWGRPQQPKTDMLNGYAYTQVKQAKDAEIFTWQRANFSTSPDIWMNRGINFLAARQLTDANPQMKDYRWGTARLVKWTAYDGKESEGVLYVPDDIDPDKKYPMLCVFYETGSEELYRHYTMEPSWSWVNYPFYVSRGYVIFVPDIHYTPGIPGESCYNYVCSGAEEMCRRYPWIDKDRIGIDGQSWGGYQTAFLVTRTDMFACAGSGAPVSNMTSAFGGIRWESGDSRQAQYEVGQSRIGRNLWESPELYIANSPVFHADRVNTPLLIMHNDGDGAVPWYQGIELFMALRRLEKPVWMLQYNGEAHNIRERRNRKDITVRLQQFFDHYLKGDPMPRWMKEGVPMIRKGQEDGYELTK